MIYNIDTMRRLKEHNLRVALLSYKLAQLLCISEPECKVIKIAARYHDIGKILIPSEVLLKPGVLTRDEFEIMKKHSTYSYEILKKKGFSEKICTMVKQHHENFDGTGYPEGLKGFDINLGARIIKVSDVFDALTNERVYRQKSSYSEAIYCMEEEINSFDSEIFEIFKNKLIAESHDTSNLYENIKIYSEEE